MQNPISLLLKSTYQIHEQPMFSIIHKKLVFKLTFLWAISHLYSLNMTMPHQTLLIRLIKNKLRHTHKHAYFGRNLQQPKQIIQYLKCNKHNSLIIFIKKTIYHYNNSWNKISMHKTILMFEKLWITTLFSCAL